VIVVLDANALASMAVARAGGTLAAILEAWRLRGFDVALSDHIFGELQRALADPYFAARLSAQDVAEYLAFIRATATFTRVAVTVQGVATHPEDDIVLATALSAGADYLVTGDKKLQDLGSYQGVIIVSPGAFLASLQA
jgi:putative PIN family toxin of toxin-antitoxin system